MAVTVGGTNITMNDSTVQSTAFLGMRATVFTSSSTFTIPTGITAVKVTVLGAGGGGAAVNNSFCPPNPGGAGGAGGMAISYLTGLTSGNTISVTIGGGGTAGTGTNGAAGGTGGASSISSGSQSISTVTANGGGGGTNVTPGQTLNQPGLGGTASGGTLNIQGQSGGLGSIGSSAFMIFSGSSAFGAGYFHRNGADPQAASGYGSGGGPSASGAGGLVIFEY